MTETLPICLSWHVLPSVPAENAQNNAKASTHAWCNLSTFITPSIFVRYPTRWTKTNNAIAFFTWAPRFLVSCLDLFTSMCWLWHAINFHLSFSIALWRLFASNFNYCKYFVVVFVFSLARIGSIEQNWKIPIQLLNNLWHCDNEVQTHNVNAEKVQHKNNEFEKNERLSAYFSMSKISCIRKCKQWKLWLLTIGRNVSSNIACTRMTVFAMLCICWFLGWMQMNCFNPTNNTWSC